MNDEPVQAERTVATTAAILRDSTCGILCPPIVTGIGTLRVVGYLESFLGAKAVFLAYPSECCTPYQEVGISGLPPALEPPLLFGLKFMFPYRAIVARAPG